jgi:hypothetical protein
MPHALREYFSTDPEAPNFVSIDQLRVDVTQLPFGIATFSLKTFAARTVEAIDSGKDVVELSPENAAEWGFFDASTTDEDAEVDPVVVKAVAEAYYSRGLAVNDRVREGAQRGYTIASAIAAALVAAGVFAHLSDRPIPVQAFGLVGLLFWLAAAVAFIWVVGMPVSTKRDKGWDTDAKFVDGVAESTERDLKKLHRRLIVALAATVVATALTIGSLAWATADPGGAKPERAIIALSPKGDAALKSVCSGPIGTIEGTIDPDDLSNDSVPVTLPPGECQKGSIEVRLPKATISVVERIKKFKKYPGLASG